MSAEAEEAHSLTVVVDRGELEVYSDGDRIVDPVAITSTERFALEMPTDRKVEADDLERDPPDLGVGDSDGQRQASGTKAVVFFKDSAIGEDDDARVSGRLVEETDDSIVLEREVPFLNLFGSGGPFGKKTVQTTVRKDALRSWSKP